MVKKYVLTGGPGCGKTTILKMLQQMGEVVVPEAAEECIRQQKELGIDQPWAESYFEELVLKMQLNREKNIPAAARIFFDRGIFDVLAYYQKKGNPPSQLIQSLMLEARQKNFYDLVFLIRHPGYIENTSIRCESLTEALWLEKIQEENYRRLGCQIIIIPNGPIQERVKKLLSYC